MYELAHLGLSERIKGFYQSQQIDLANIARVVQEHKELYIIQNDTAVFNAEITGNMRFMAESRADFPAVGDWVEVSVFENNQAIIHKILPRISLLERQSVGVYGEKQIIAANIDFAFIVQAVDGDFNLNRLERYFVIAHNGDIEPVIVLNKTDLISGSELEDMKSIILDRLNSPKLITSTIFSDSGTDALKDFLLKGLTYCFLGSSGVGKSSLINRLTGSENLSTGDINESTGRGRHTTSHRKIQLLDNGSVLIDTPGMREIGITEEKSGVELIFNEILKLAGNCKFKNCTHTDEPGCKVLESMENGQLDLLEFENYKKLERQSAHFNTTIVQKRQKDKYFGKMYKDIMIEKKKNKY